MRVLLTLALSATTLLACVRRDDGAILVNAVAFCQAARPRVPPPPPEPEIDWMPSGCPSAFGACLSGADAARMLDYMRRVNQWKRAVARAEGAR